MSRNNSPARRKTRREQADNCARRNEVIDCACGNRHATTWRGCSVLPDDPGVRLLQQAKNSRHPVRNRNEKGQYA